mmetsp:Transcript_15651/g.38982  ORF Transcript_15651/g.38982 Transcript_15651/m.38982 type:complete len:356 (+) Transcript_15651:301-1368(+)
MRACITTSAPRMPQNSRWWSSPSNTSVSSLILRQFSWLKSCMNTNVLNTIVWHVTSSTLSISCPWKTRKYRVTSWKADWPRMCLATVELISGCSTEQGGRSSMASVGDSVANARLARESMMRLTHSICTALRGDTCSAIAPAHAVATATTLAVSWNCRNLVTDAYTLRPHLTALTMDEKESSMSRMSAASLAMQVPLFMAKPTSAAVSAGASLVPSPVIATTSTRGSSPLRSAAAAAAAASAALADADADCAAPSTCCMGRSTLFTCAASSPMAAATVLDCCRSCLRADTSRNLSVGEQRAMTLSLGHRVLKVARSREPSGAVTRLLNWGPSSTSPASGSSSGSFHPAPTVKLLA